MAAANTSRLVGTLVLSSILSIIFLLLFILMRRRYKRFYMPLIYDPKLNSANRPKECLGAFEWISYTIKYPAREVMHTAGLDAYEYLNFLWQSLIVFLIISVYNIIILLPINLTSTNNQKDVAHPEHVDGMDRLYIGNIEQGSARFWAHLMSVGLFSLLTYNLGHKLYLSAVKWNKQHVLRRKQMLRYRTVLVKHLPEEIESSDKLKNMFDKMYPNQVEKALLIPFIPKLQSMQADRKKALKQWKRSINKLNESKLGNRPVHRISCCGDKVDSIAYYERKIRRLHKEINKELQLPHEHMPIGFITFKSLSQAIQCSQTLHISVGKCVASRAPVAADISWKFLISSKESRYIRIFCVWALLTFLFLFWTIPVTFISAWSNINTLSKVPVLNKLFRLASGSPTVTGILEGFLPTLSLNIFMGLLPIILKLIMDHRGYALFSRLERNLMRIYWLFLFINVLLVSAIAGSIFKTLGRLIDHPDGIVERLATSLPSQATFFTNYIITDILISIPFLLLRIPDFILCKINQWLFCKSEEEKIEAESPVPFEYYVQYARELLIFNIALVFSTMSPVITGFAVIYFAIAYFRAKYNYIYVFPAAFNEGIQMTPLVVNRITIGLFIYQITFLGIFTAKAFPPGGSVVLLLILTAVYKWYLGKHFVKPYKYIPLQDCCNDDGSSDCISPTVKEELDKMYLDPSLLPPDPEEIAMFMSSNRESSSIHPNSYLFRVDSDPDDISLKMIDDVPEIHVDSGSHLTSSQEKGSNINQETTSSTIIPLDE